VSDKKIFTAFVFAFNLLLSFNVNSGLQVVEKNKNIGDLETWFNAIVFFDQKSSDIRKKILSSSESEAQTVKNLFRCCSDGLITENKRKELLDGIDKICKKVYEFVRSDDESVKDQADQILFSLFYFSTNLKSVVGRVS